MITFAQQFRKKFESSLAAPLHASTNLWPRIPYGNNVWRREGDQCKCLLSQM